MALSNWDTLAFGLDGQPTVGRYTGPSGVSVEIYKNWVYLKKDGLVVEVQHGYFSTDVTVIAERYAPQSSVFVLARRYTEKTYEGFCGIGCYGYKGELDWLKEKHPDQYAKIDPKWLDPAQDVIQGTTYYGDRWGLHFLGNGDSVDYWMDCPEPELDELWTGVLPETVAAFYAWLEKLAQEHEIEAECVARIKANKPLRYNQGDAFLNQALTTRGQPERAPEDLAELGELATPPGESTGTILGKLL